MTDEENVPVLDTTTTQHEHHPPRECRTRAPRFLADEEEQGIDPHTMSLHPQPRPCPQPQPCPIPTQQAQAVLEPPSAHESGAQMPGSTIASQTP